MSDTSTHQQGNPDQLMRALQDLETQMHQATTLFLPLKIKNKALRAQLWRTAEAAGWLEETLTEATK